MTACYTSVLGLYMSAVSETSTLVQSSQWPNLFPSQNFCSYVVTLLVQWLTLILILIDHLLVRIMLIAHAFVPNGGES